MELKQLVSVACPTCKKTGGLYFLPRQTPASKNTFVCNCQASFSESTAQYKELIAQTSKNPQNTEH